MANLTVYKGKYAQTGTYSRIANSNSTELLRQRLYKDLGLNIESIGKLTPEMVRASSLRIKHLAQQVKMAQVYASNAEQQQAALAELEQIRLTMLKGGDKTLRGMDKSLKSAADTTARHGQHMQYMQQSSAHSLAEIAAQGRSSLEQENAGFVQRMRNLASTHRSKMAYIQQNGQMELKTTLEGLAAAHQGKRQQLVEAQESARFDRQQAFAQNNFMNFITGKGRARKSRGGLFG